MSSRDKLRVGGGRDEANWDNDAVGLNGGEVLERYKYR